MPKRRPTPAAIDVPSDERLVPQDEVLSHWYPVHRSTLWRAWTSGAFPPPVVLSSGKICWRLSQLRQFIAERQQHPISRRRYVAPRDREADDAT